MFAKLVTNIVAMGIKTLHLLTSAKTPWNPDDVPKPSFEAGYVRASTMGSVVCMPKYTGNSFCWSWEN